MSPRELNGEPTLESTIKRLARACAGAPFPGLIAPGNPVARNRPYTHERIYLSTGPRFRARRGFYNNPRVLKLLCPDRLITMWSWTAISTVAAAAWTASVIAISTFEGVGSPEG